MPSTATALNPLARTFADFLLFQTQTSNGLKLYLTLASASQNVGLGVQGFGGSRLGLGFHVFRFEDQGSY